MYPDSDPMFEASRPAPPAVARRWLPWLLVLAGFLFDCCAYWPGQMSFDSAYTWWQARGGATTDIVPPAFVLVWRAGEALHSGPGLMFALHLGLFWCGLALLLRALRFGSLAVLASVIVVAFAPVPWLLRGHVWTDVGLFSALCFTTGALACAHTGYRRGWLLLALPALFYASALRHNALPALLPFAAWFAWLAVQREDASMPPTPPRAALATLALLALVLLVTQAIDTTAQRRVPLWPMLAQWDLAAVSVATGQMRLPAFMIGPGLDIADLTQAFRGWSTTPMLQNTRHGMRDPFSEYSSAQLAALRGAWLHAIVDDPHAWLAHRWRLTRALFGDHAPEWPHELIYVDAEVPYRDNPEVAANATPLHRALMRAAAVLVATPALAAWPYLLIGLLGIPPAWKNRHTPAGTIALILLASAWLYALPFAAIAASAELRYLGWPCVASLLAFACAYVAPRPVARC